MTKGIKTIIYPVKDLGAAKALYTGLLGVEPSADSPYYVGFDVPGAHVGLDPSGQSAGATAYWEVDDIAKAVQVLLDAGATTEAAVRDVGNGRLIASLRDQDGNLIGLLQDS